MSERIHSRGDSNALMLLNSIEGSKEQTSTGLSLLNNKNHSSNGTFKNEYLQKSLNNNNKTIEGM